MAAGDGDVRSVPPRNGRELLYPQNPQNIVPPPRQPQQSLCHYAAVAAGGPATVFQPRHGHDPPHPLPVKNYVLQWSPKNPYGDSSQDQSLLVHNTRHRTINNHFQSHPRHGSDLVFGSFPYDSPNHHRNVPDETSFGGFPGSNESENRRQHSVRSVRNRQWDSPGGGSSNAEERVGKSWMRKQQGSSYRPSPREPARPPSGYSRKPVGGLNQHSIKKGEMLEHSVDGNRGNYSKLNHLDERGRRMSSSPSELGLSDQLGLPAGSDICSILPSDSEVFVSPNRCGVAELVDEPKCQKQSNTKRDSETVYSRFHDEIDKLGEDLRGRLYRSIPSQPSRQLQGSAKRNQRLEQKMGEKRYNHGKLNHLNENVRRKSTGDNELGLTDQPHQPSPVQGRKLHLPSSASEELLSDAHSGIIKFVNEPKLQDKGNRKKDGKSDTPVSLNATGGDSDCHKKRASGGNARRRQQRGETCTYAPSEHTDPPPGVQGKWPRGGLRRYSVEEQRRSSHNVQRKEDALTEQNHVDESVRIIPTGQGKLGLADQLYLPGPPAGSDLHLVSASEIEELLSETCCGIVEVVDKPEFHKQGKLGQGKFPLQKQGQKRLTGQLNHPGPPAGSDLHFVSASLVEELLSEMPLEILDVVDKPKQQKQGKLGLTDQLDHPGPPGSNLHLVSASENEELLSVMHCGIVEVVDRPNLQKQGTARRHKGSVDRGGHHPFGDKISRCSVIEDKSVKKNSRKQQRVKKRTTNFRAAVRTAKRGKLIFCEKDRNLRKLIQCRDDINRFNSTFLTLYQCLIPTEEEKGKQQQLLALLESLVRKEWPKARVHLYGSCANSFAISKSDLDVCVEIEEPYLNKDEVLLKLADIFQSHNLQNVEAVTSARVPIVKLVDPVMEISCDISINNVLAVTNTKLLRDYARLDVRLRQLVFIVKHWAKSRGVDNTKLRVLSSYAYVLMCIHFLQQRKPAILPCLQGMEATYAVQVADIECAFFDQVENLGDFGSQNNESVAQLVWAFFSYWAYCHDYENSVISVRVGGILSKQEKDWTRQMPKENHFICIEDPFDISYDLGRRVDKYRINVLREEFERAAEIMQSDPNPCESLLQPYVWGVVK